MLHRLIIRRDGGATSSDPSDTAGKSPSPPQDAHTNYTTPHDDADTALDALSRYAPLDAPGSETACPPHAAHSPHTDPMTDATDASPCPSCPCPSVVHGSENNTKRKIEKINFRVIYTYSVPARGFDFSKSQTRAIDPPPSVTPGGLFGQMA